MTGHSADAITSESAKTMEHESLQGLQLECPTGVDMGANEDRGAAARARKHGSRC